MLGHRRRFYFSLSGLMALVVILAIAMAALRARSDVWASAIYTSMVTALLLSAVGIICRRGRRRAFWAGFLIFAGGYAWLSFGPHSHQGVMPPTLLTTKLLSRWELVGITWGRLPAGGSPPLSGADLSTNTVGGYAMYGPPVMEYSSMGHFFTGPTAYLHQTVHSLVALVFGLVGAQIAFCCWTHEDADRTDGKSADPTASP